MASFFPTALENLIDKFAMLPGIGKKSAQRLAFFVLSLPEGEAESFADAIIQARGSVYHVLHGVLSPLSHIGPDDLKISELVNRVAAGGVEEVIMALNPDTEGETTSMYISRLLKPFGVRVTRLAYGIPVGSNLEFADDATLQRALEGRVDM